MSLTPVTAAVVAAYVQDRRLWPFGEPAAVEQLVITHTHVDGETTTLDLDAIFAAVSFSAPGRATLQFVARARAACPPSVQFKLPVGLQNIDDETLRELLMPPASQPDGPASGEFKRPNPPPVPPPQVSTSVPRPSSPSPSPSSQGSRVKTAVMLLVILACVGVSAFSLAPRFRTTTVALPADGVPCRKTFTREGILYCTVNQDAMPIDILWGDARRRIVKTKEAAARLGWSKLFFLEQSGDGRWLSPLWDRDPVDPNRRGDP